VNYPVGQATIKGDIPFDLAALSQKLSQDLFSGYIIQSVKGTFIEEGVLFFRDGELSGCVVECLPAQALLKGNEALPFFLNQTKGVGFYQCVELTRSQVDLVVAFDEKILIDKIALKDLPKMIPSAFLPRFAKAQSAKDALETYGLGDLK
jgi:hypothetical protein